MSKKEPGVYEGSLQGENRTSYGKGTLLSDAIVASFCFVKESLKDFNNNIEQWTIEYKQHFTTSERIDLKTLNPICS